MKYRFVPVSACEMCGSPTSEHILLGARLNKSQGRNPRAVSGISVSIKKCRQCDLIFPDPMPVPASISDHYGTPAEHYWKKAYFESDPDYFEREIKVAKRLIGFVPGMNALDIGAGIGKGMKAMDSAGFQTFGIEPSERFREQALSRIGIAPDRLQLASIEGASFEPHSFDLITFGAVLEHIYEPASALEKALSWLKPAGILHVEVPSSSWAVSKILNAFYRVMGTTYVTNLSPMHVPYHLHEFGLRSFQKHGVRAGYKIEEYEVMVCSICNIPKLLHRPLRKYMERTNTGMQLVVWLRLI